MFPNAPNLRFQLLDLDFIPDALGNRTPQLVRYQCVVGMTFSITAKEHYESKRSDIKVHYGVKIQSFLYKGSSYALVQDTIYKIERRYQSGHFTELYLSETKWKRGDVVGLPR